MTISDDLKQVLGQIRWADGRAKRCQPYTPTDTEARDAWGKLRGLDKLQWGCKVRIVWQDYVDWMAEEFGADWEKEGEANGDEGYLIALPGARCSDPGDPEAIVWVPHVQAEKCEGEPVWVQLQVLLANPMVAWVEVIKES